MDSRQVGNERRGGLWKGLGNGGKFVDNVVPIENSGDGENGILGVDGGLFVVNDVRQGDFLEGLLSPDSVMGVGVISEELLPQVPQTEGERIVKKFFNASDLAINFLVKSCVVEGGG